MPQEALQVAALLGLPGEERSRARLRGGEGSRRQAQLSACREDGRTLQDVVQLPHIAGPGIGLQLGPHRRGQLDGGTAVLPGEALQEGFGQIGDVSRPLPQGRDVNGEDAQPVEQVLAEAPFGHGLPQVLMGGGQQPYIHPPGLLAAQGIDLALLDGAQQLGLEVQGQVADLVQEQRAAIRQLEATLSRCHGPAEGTLYVAEELGLDEGGGQGAAVHLDEGLLPAGREVVQGLGHLLLARAGLAGDEHGGGGAGHLAYLIQDGAHGGALSAEGLLQHVPALDLPEVADLLSQGALPLGEAPQVLRLLEAQGQQGGEHAHVVEHALGVLAADHGIQGHEPEGLALTAQRRHQTAVAVGHLQEAVEGIQPRVVLLEGGRAGAGLQGVLEAEVASHGDEDLGQLGCGQRAKGVGHPEGIAFPQEHRRQVVGDQLRQALEGVGHHALRLLAQGEQRARFFHQTGPREGGLQIGCGQGVPPA